MSGSGRSPRGARAGAARRERGAVFVDAMIACVVVAGALAATFQLIADVAARARQEAARSEALLVGQSALAQAGTAVPLAPGETAGVAGPFVWTLDVTSYGAQGPPDRAGALMKVEVRVRPRAGGQDLARLESLRLAAVRG